MSELKTGSYIGRGRPVKKKTPGEEIRRNQLWTARFKYGWGNETKLECWMDLWSMKVCQFIILSLRLSLRLWIKFSCEVNINVFHIFADVCTVVKENEQIRLAVINRLRPALSDITGSETLKNLAVDWIERCWHQNPDRRPSFAGMYMNCLRFIIPIVTTLRWLSEIISRGWKYCPMPKVEGSISNWGEKFPTVTDNVSNYLFCYISNSNNNVTKSDVNNFTGKFLLLARYVPNVAKEELWDQCKKYEYWRPTNDRRPTSGPIHTFWENFKCL